MNDQRTLILLDNGSTRAQSTLSLRRISSALSERVGEFVHPVSLMHADKVSVDALEGCPADTFEPFLRARALAGERRFLILPLFFGPSRALSAFVPEKAEQIGADFGPLSLRIADILCPLPHGEPRLAEILLDNLLHCAKETEFLPKRIVLVDHGSPIPAVTTVRRSLAADLRQCLGTGVRVDEAVMERRTGVEYDFNGDLLENLLRQLAEEDRNTPVILSMLFMFAGRHAGPNGDIERIYRTVEREFPGFRVHQGPLVSDHPRLVDILQSRLEAALAPIPSHLPEGNKMHPQRGFSR